MKTLHYSIIAVLISCMFLLSCSTTHSASALYSHGNLDLEKIGDTKTTQLEFNNSTITFEQYVNKTTYKVGEIIYVYGQLRNVGIHDLYVSYLGPATSSVLKDQNGKLTDSFGGAYVLEGGPYGNETLHPNTTTTLRVWDFPRNVVGGGPWSLQVQPAELVSGVPGNYYVRSMTTFNYHVSITSEPHNNAIILWSTPLLITILPEQYIQNETNSSALKISSNPTSILAAEPTANPECVDKIMAQEHAQDMPIDNVRALDLAKNYAQYKLKTLGHNYTLNRIYHNFSIDSCTAQIKDVIVEFVEKNSLGHSLITITEDLGVNRVKSLDISQVNDEPVTHVTTYMTPMEPQIDDSLILFIVLVIGVISVVVFFIFKMRKKI